MSSSRKPTFLSSFDSFIANHDVSMPVARPDHWGGYRLFPERYEFWQGASHRLNDRFEYKINGNEWCVKRLSP
jgi:pyridoxamine 5'-phosphate oxidase